MWSSWEHILHLVITTDDVSTLTAHTDNNLSTTIVRASGPSAVSGAITGACIACWAVTCNGASRAFTHFRAACCTAVAVPINVVRMGLASRLTGHDMVASDCVLMERLRRRALSLHWGEQGLRGFSRHISNHVENGSWWCNRTPVGRGNRFPPGYNGSVSLGHLVFICGMKGLGVFLSELVPSPGSSIGCSGQQLVLQAVLRHVGGMRGGTDADPMGFTGSIRETQR
ncbi:hypothetical protein NP493_206g03017 [Ridgeia piscesae]|uniref:Uncharacterized protein n=1 Tax=Ridgeia piscesae TaxID=27915 RepID=A0AAD9UEB9_RIDPI|nr:hypothetical protein NP493_206g03017 [Ridgeia piscesae]